LNAGLHGSIIFDGFHPHMANDDFAEIQRKLETITLELKTVNDCSRKPSVSAANHRK
jgi:hypothetical protein